MAADRSHRYCRSETQITRLAEFCGTIQADYAEQFRRQSVLFTCDVPNELSYEMPRVLVRQILDSWILEALRSMREGGELDLIVVVSSKGLEIEIADSRDVQFESAVAEGVCGARVADKYADYPVQVEAANCPQGGVARTLFIPLRDARGLVVQPNEFRKVA